MGKVDSLIKMLALSHLILVGVRMRWGRWIVSYKMLALSHLIPVGLRMRWECWIVSSTMLELSWVISQGHNSETFYKLIYIIKRML
jgi:hypothetical protein